MRFEHVLIRRLLANMKVTTMAEFRALTDEQRLPFIEWHRHMLGGDLHDAWDTALDVLPEDDRWEDPYE